MGDEAFGGLLEVASAEVVAAEVVGEFAGGEDVRAGADDRVFDGAEGFLVAAAGFEASVVRGKANVVGPDRGEAARSMVVLSRAEPCRGMCHRHLLPVGSVHRSSGRQCSGR